MARRQRAGVIDTLLISASRNRAGRPGDQNVYSARGNTGEIHAGIDGADYAHARLGRALLDRAEISCGTLERLGVRNSGRERLPEESAPAEPCWGGRPRSILLFRLA